MWQSSVPILATRELVAPLANNTIILGRSIYLFRHLKYQNLSTGDDFIHNNGMILWVEFLAIKKALVQLANDPILWERLILLFRYLQHRNPSITSDTIGWARIVQQFWRSSKGTTGAAKEYSWVRWCDYSSYILSMNFAHYISI